MDHAGKTVKERKKEREGGWEPSGWGLAREKGRGAWREALEEITGMEITECNRNQIGTL